MRERDKRTCWQQILTVIGVDKYTPDEWQQHFLNFRECWNRSYLICPKKSDVKHLRPFLMPQLPKAAVTAKRQPQTICRAFAEKKHRPEGSPIRRRLTIANPGQPPEHGVRVTKRRETIANHDQGPSEIDSQSEDESIPLSMLKQRMGGDEKVPELKRKRGRPPLHGKGQRGQAAHLGKSQPGKDPMQEQQKTEEKVVFLQDGNSIEQLNLPSHPQNMNDLPPQPIISRAKAEVKSTDQLDLFQPSPKKIRLMEEVPPQSMTSRATVEVKPTEQQPKKKRFLEEVPTPPMAASRAKAEVKPTEQQPKKILFLEDVPPPPMPARPKGTKKSGGKKAKATGSKSSRRSAPAMERDPKTPAVKVLSSMVVATNNNQYILSQINNGEDAPMFAHKPPGALDLTSAPACGPEATLTSQAEECLPQNLKATKEIISQPNYNLKMERGMPTAGDGGVGGERFDVFDMNGVNELAVLPTVEDGDASAIDTGLGNLSTIGTPSSDIGRQNNVPGLPDLSWVQTNHASLLLQDEELDYDEDADVLSVAASWEDLDDSPDAKSVKDNAKTSKKPPPSRPNTEAATPKETLSEVSPPTFGLNLPKIRNEGLSQIPKATLSQALKEQPAVMRSLYDKQEKTVEQRKRRENTVSRWSKNDMPVFAPPFRTGPNHAESSNIQLLDAQSNQQEQYRAHTSSNRQKDSRMNSRSDTLTNIQAGSAINQKAALNQQAVHRTGALLQQTHDLSNRQGLNQLNNPSSNNPSSNQVMPYGLTDNRTVNQAETVLNLPTGPRRKPLTGSIKNQQLNAPLKHQKASIPNCQPVQIVKQAFPPGQPNQPYGRKNDQAIARTQGRFSCNYYIMKVFGVHCLQFLDNQCHSPSCNHNSDSVGEVQNRLMRMKENELLTVYQYSIRSVYIVRNYFLSFAEIFRRRKLRQHLFQMIIDCRLYRDITPPHLVQIFEMLRRDGMAREATACIMQNLWLPEKVNKYREMTLEILFILSNGNWNDYVKQIGDLERNSDFVIPIEMFICMANSITSQPDNVRPLLDLVLNRPQRVLFGCNPILWLQQVVFSNPDFTGATEYVNTYLAGLMATHPAGSSGALAGTDPGILAICQGTQETVHPGAGQDTVGITHPGPGTSGISGPCPAGILAPGQGAAGFMLPSYAGSSGACAGAGTGLLAPGQGVQRIMHAGAAGFSGTGQGAVGIMRPGAAGFSGAGQGAVGIMHPGLGTSGISGPTPTGVLAPGQGTAGFMHLTPGAAGFMNPSQVFQGQPLYRAAIGAQPSVHGMDLLPGAVQQYLSNQTPNSHPDNRVGESMNRYGNFQF
ncbi:hypothetical protein KR018_011100 [Drosophila ironensis]|nr:hypothetical protein KR018_011100 [Drosophila ironensis]